ncbi:MULTISPECIES: F390 synthetase-related protein [unclassified Acinetobacter]|uniref:F390 synthetase-related protein n=1 Tax=unclassified Acinetobacter TaxID=196816 RepID=UPI0035B839FF
MKASKWAIIKSFFAVKDYQDREQLQQHQQRALQHRLATHNSQFYPHSSDLAAYPIINKKIFMANFADINRYQLSEHDALSVALQAEQSRDFSPVIDTPYGSVSVGLSSGTSGSRGIFLVSKDESALWAGYMLRRMLPRPYLARHSVAFFLRANSNLYDSVKSILLRFEFYDLFSGLNAHIQRLNQQQPSILIAPAQVLQQLAQHPDVHIQPQKIISVAEVLEPQVKAEIEHRFGVMVHQIYQCTEGFLAHTCEHGNLHLNEDMLYLEKDWIDQASGRFSPIITDFHRSSQPIIRYRLDDVLILDERPCPCGSAFTRLAGIEGRCDDILIGKSLHDDKDVPIYADFIRRAIIACDDVQEYYVAQQGNRLDIQLLPDSIENQQAVDMALNQLWQSLDIQPLQHHFQAYQSQALHQKRRRVVHLS